MSRFSFHFVIVVIFLTAVSIVSCQKETKTFTVTFDVNNGSPLITQQVAKGQKLTKPNDPVRIGSEGLYKDPPPFNDTFEGWYNNGNPPKWDFDFDVVNADITLLAQWRSNAIGISSQTGSEILTKALTYIKSRANA